MNSKSYYNEILTEHNRFPEHKHPMMEPRYKRQGVNPSCGDDVVLNLDVEDGIITAGSFEGSGCAISQASIDIMLDLVIGKSVDEALELSDIFMKMIKEEISCEEEEKLEEAAALKDVSHMPARVKCATLGWRTLREILG